MIRRDPVHGLVAFEGPFERVIVPLLATREVQRLRNVRQLGFTSLVFPGAEHSRFAHAVGAAHVMVRLLARVRAVVSERVVGQETVINESLVAFLARGHALLVGVPGAAKTMLVRVLAGALNPRFARITFTPALMPAAITGITVLRTGGPSSLYRAGTA